MANVYLAWLWIGLKAVLSRPPTTSEFEEAIIAIEDRFGKEIFSVYPKNKS